MLFEHTVHNGVIHGFTDNYIRVEVPAENAQDLDNRLANVVLGGLNAGETALKGTIIL